MLSVLTVWLIFLYNAFVGIDTAITHRGVFMGNNKLILIIYRIILIITGVIGGIFLFLRVRLYLSGYTSNELASASMTVFQIYKVFGYAAFFLTLLTLKSTPKAASAIRCDVMIVLAVALLAFDTYSAPSAEGYSRGWATVLLDTVSCCCVLNIFTSIHALVKALVNK